MNSQFKKDQFELSYPNGVEHNYWSKTRNYILWKNIQKCKIQNENFIEIGCGRGGVVKYLQNKSIDCFGVELASCTPHVGAEEFIITGTDALDIEENLRKKFTVLMLLDVIEHLESPISFIKGILEKYTNITTIIITVPARQEIWSNYDVFYGHFQRYNLEKTQDFIRKINFHSSELYYFFHSLYPAARLQLSISKNRKIKITSPKGIVKLIHKLISIYFIIEYHLFPKFWKGTSILSISNKN